MSKWEITYLENDNGSCPVQDWLDELPKIQYKLVANKLILLEKCGNELKMPNSKPLKQGLFELRELSFGLRLYYCFSGKRIIIIVHYSDKDGQQKDIKYARTLVAKFEKEHRKNET